MAGGSARVVGADGRRSFINGRDEQRQVDHGIGHRLATDDQGTGAARSREVFDVYNKNKT